jgi:hypothetical protein
MTELVCKVGGRVYHTTVEDLTKVEGSFFQTALSKDWSPQSSTVLEITRNGAHFQHVLDYFRFGHLPRDASGRCNIPQESLEELRVEADFYGLPLLVAEVDRLLKFKVKGMRYFISSFELDSSPDSGSLNLKEYSTYEEALAVYSAVKNGYKKRKASSDGNGDDEDGGEGSDGDIEHGEGKQVIVNEETDEKTGKIDFEVYEGVGWKHPQGTQLLCIPLTEHVAKDGALYDCYVRTVPDERE